MRSPNHVHIIIRAEVGCGRCTNRKVGRETEAKACSCHQERREVGNVAEQVLDSHVGRAKILCAWLSCAYAVPGDAEGIYYGRAHDKGVAEGQRLSHVIRAGAVRSEER